MGSGYVSWLICEGVFNRASVSASIALRMIGIRTGLTKKSGFPPPVRNGIREGVLLHKYIPFLVGELLSCTFSMLEGSGYSKGQ